MNPKSGHLVDQEHQIMHTVYSRTVYQGVLSNQGGGNHVIFPWAIM